jgi:hypothetical protein
MREAFQKRREDALFMETSYMKSKTRKNSLRRTVKRAAQTAALTLLLPSGMIVQAHAQSESGQVVGTVKDPAGAVIPGATLTLTNGANGLVLTAKSNGSGELRVPAVPRGDYTAKIEAPGFQSQTEPVTVNVTSTQTVVFQLVPGSVSSNVEVTGAASLVNTNDPTLGETIEGKQITELPLNGRNALNLALLTPGVTTGAYVEYGQDTINRNIDSGGGQISVNGVRAQANNFILDGIDNNDGLQNVIVFFPPVDATQEFKVDTSVAPAQYGRAGGALIISSIKSGTNQLHGSAFYFNRSSAYESNPNYRFQGAAFTPTQSYSRNQFGGSAGLPLVKNKLFIFGDYQGTRVNQPGGAHFVTVPTAKMRTGDFSELLNPNLTYGTFNTTFPVCVPNYSNMNNDLATYSKGQIYDPQTNCQTFPGNIIPQGRLNPAAVNYLNAYPLPTRTDRVLQNYSVVQNSTTKFNTFDTRLDWNPASTDLFFFRFSYDNSTSFNQSEFPLLPASGGSNYTHARGYDLGYTHTFSAHAVNEARIGYNRDNYGYFPTDQGTPVSANLGIVNANRSPQLSGGALIGGNGNQIEYTGDYGTFAVPQNTYEVTDTLNLNRGKHSLNVGGTFLYRNVNYFRPIAGKGQFYFTGNGAGFTGFEDTEMLVGGAGNYSIGAQSGFFGNVSQEDGVFAQDDWRVNNRLTLNLGVRWDLLTWPYEKHDNQAAFNINNGTVLEAGKNGVPRSIINQDYTNFAPRVGFAYDLHGDGKSSIHGGYGMFYFPDYGGISNQLGQQPPFGGTSVYYAYQGYCLTFTGQTAAPSTAPGGFRCPGYTNASAVTTPLPAPGYPASFNPAAPQNYNGLAVNQNNQHSRLQEWNLQVQQQVGPLDVVSIAYVGSRGDRLSTYYNYNTFRLNTPTEPFPNQGGITYNDYNGHSNYDGLQVHYEHRGKNVLATGSYAWSHALDDSASAYGGTPTTTLLYYDEHANYGNSIQDQRNIFSSSIVWYLPFGRGERFGGSANHLTDLLIGGWQLNNIAQVQSGQPVDLFAAGSSAPGIRPDLIAPIRYPKSISGRWFDPASFSSNIPSIPTTNPGGSSVSTREGTLGRGQVYGPGYRTVNLGVQKDLHLLEGKVLELHGDAFNVLNTPNFLNPGNAQGNPGTFGVITGIHGELRQIQLAARLTF